MTDRFRPPSHRRPLSLPREGVEPEPLHEVDSGGGCVLSGRPAVRRRERPVRVRPGRPEAPAQDQVPDADAQRGAGAASPRATTRRTGSSRSAARAKVAAAGASARPRRATRHRDIPARLSSRRACAAEPAPARGPGGFPLHRFAARVRLAHQPRQRAGAGGHDRRGRRPAALPREPPRLGPRAWAELDLVGRTSRRRAAPPADHKRTRALRGDQRRPGHGQPRPDDPADARRSISAIPIAASTPRYCLVGVCGTAIPSSSTTLLRSRCHNRPPTDAGTSRRRLIRRRRRCRRPSAFRSQS